MERCWSSIRCGEAVRRLSAAVAAVMLCGHTSCVAAADANVPLQHQAATAPKRSSYDVDRHAQAPSETDGAPAGTVDSSARDAQKGAASDETTEARSNEPLPHLSACVHAQAGGRGSDLIEASQSYLENARRRFAAADFYKPDPVENLLPIEQALLIVQEVPSDAQAMIRRRRFGAVQLHRPNRFTINTDDPAVYVQDRRIKILGHEYAERVFALYFIGPGLGPDAGHMISVHLVLDRDGFPLTALIWDVWNQERRRRCGSMVFVSESLEAKAQEQFGASPSGARYAIEKLKRTRCEPFVVSTFADGPIPLGPYLYVNPSGYVTTVRCRCSPSQMDEIKETRNYRLASLDEVYAIRALLPEDGGAQLPLPASPETVSGLIDRGLRWPLDAPRKKIQDENR